MPPLLLALLTLPIALPTADAAAQLGPGLKNYTLIELTFNEGTVTSQSAVLTASTNTGSFTAGDGHWSLTQSFVQTLQRVRDGDSLELEASAGSQFWARGAPQYPITGALGSFKMPSRARPICASSNTKQ